MSSIDPGSMSPEEFEAYLNSPAAMPPDGEIPDFARIDNRNGLGRFVIIMNIVVPSLFSLSYLYARIFIIREFVHSDIYAVIALGLHLAFLGVCMKILDVYGMHVHQWDLQVREMPPYMADYFVTVVLYILSAMFAKVGILLQWVRIFVPRGTRTDSDRKIMFWGSIGLLWFNVAYHVAAVLLFIIPCTPFYKNDEQGAELFTCVPPIKFDFIESVLNVVLELLIMLVPQKVIWSLKIPTKQKLGISVVFSLGIFAIAVAIARIIVTTKWYYVRGLFGDADGASADSTYTMTDMTYVCMAETSLHILIYMLPATPKAVKGLGFGKILSSIGSIFTTTLRPLLTRSRDTTSRRTPRHKASSEADEAGLVNLEFYSSTSERMDHPYRQQFGRPSQSSKSSVGRPIGL